MPPKKKKPTPVVVGTVSTRSTRRESIVNIEIIPKANKSVSSILAPKKTPKNCVKTPRRNDIEPESEKTSPEILEILRDWSDDENSKESLLPQPISTGRKFTINKKHNSSSVSADEQSLIDILEGNHLGPRRSVSKVAAAKGLNIDNLIVNVGSPQIEDSEIIEECVVEDNSIIIELHEEQIEMTPQDGVSIDQNKDLKATGYASGGKIPPDMKTTDNHASSKLLDRFDISRDNKKIVKKKNISRIIQEVKPDLNESSKCSTNELDEESQSMTSEDTTSQSMITVQDEDGCDVNDIQMSDNSTNNYEVIEEQVVFDSSEPIIIESVEDVQSNLQIELEQNIETQTTKEMVISSDNQLVDKLKKPKKSSQKWQKPSKGSFQEVSSKIEESPNNFPEVVKEILSRDFPDKACEEELLLQPSSKSSKSASLQKGTVIFDNVQRSNKNIVTVDKKTTESISETKANAKVSSRSSSISNQQAILETKKEQITQNTIPELDKCQAYHVKASEIHIPAESQSLAASEENTLCQKINELMGISGESPNVIDFHPASDQLQEGIQKMHIGEEVNHTEFRSEAIDKTGYGNSSQSVVSFPTQREKSFNESNIEKSPQNYIAKVDVKRRRRTRWQPLEDEAQKSEINIKEESAKIQNISDKDILNSDMDSTFECSFQEKQGKKIPEKIIESEKTESCLKKHVKSPSNLKEESKKSLDTHASSGTKMDIDSESSKTSEAEGDSTSNESSQSSNSTKMSKSRAKKLFTEQLAELDKMDILRTSETKLNRSDMDISIGDILNKRSKGTKTKTKSPLKALDIDEEMEKMHVDSNKFANTSDNLKSHADIDATIDDVLRRYTLEDPSTPEECASPKVPKSNATKHAKESRKKKEAKLRRDEISEEVRRSDRIKTILPIKKKSHGLVRSKSESALSAEAESSDSNSVHSELDKVTPVSPQLTKKHKAKSKAKSTESLQIPNSRLLLSEHSPEPPKSVDLKADKSGKAEIEARLKTFIHLKENHYKTDRQVCKEAREMICDCYLAEEDIRKDEYGCGEDCLNRLLMIECGYLCQIGDRCTNKRFQKGQFAPVEVFKTEKKGLGLIAAANIPYGEFILEYVGEVLNPDEFDKRAEVYSKDKNIHFYFMSLRADAIIDATMKGNISRFINHSCDPNAETQKWTVNGELRIGFFSTRTILAGEEITFDYKFQRYGKEAQKCYCGAATCRGWLGERPDESEDEDEEDDEESSKVEQVAGTKAEIKVSTTGIFKTHEKELAVKKPTVEMEIDVQAESTLDVKVPQEASAIPNVEETPKKVIKRKPRKELLFEDLDQLNEDIDMVVTTGLKNQAHTLKLSRLMVRAKDLDQRKKLLRVLRRGELPCRRLFLDYHGLRFMHGYMIDAQQMTNGDRKSNASQLEFLQTKLELLQTLAVLPIQNKTMLIESKVLPAVEKWAKNEDLVEDNCDHKDAKNSPKDLGKYEDSEDPGINEKIDEIKFLASKLLEEWVNLKESFRIPKKQRIEQMKEHEKEANRKFVESSYAQERESSRKNDQRYRSWSRYKSERETNKKGYREDKDRPSAEYLKMSKHERRKLFALQMELKEEERRLKQREMWRQHEMNCIMIGADPRFTAPFDPSKGFQYIWNPSIGQWQALPVPSTQNQGVSGYNVPPTHKSALLGPYTPPMLSVAGMTGQPQQYPGMPPTIAPMVPGLQTSVSTIANVVPGMATTIPGMAGLVPGMTGPIHGISGSPAVMSGSVQGIAQPPLSGLPMYSEVKQVEDDPSQVKFAGPIPPPVKLPPKWKCAKDKYGRPYYYHVKVRKSQWEPPVLSEDIEESASESSSSETSSLSSSDTSSDSETDDEIDDTKLLMEVKKQMETNQTKLSSKSVIPQHVKKEERDSGTPSPDVKAESDNEESEELKEDGEEHNSEPLSSIDIRLKEQFNLDNNDPPRKKRRIGLCQEIIISPRTDEDRQQFKEDLKRYKATKEKLKRQKDQMLHQAKKKLKTSAGVEDTKKSKDKRILKNTAKSRIKQMEWNDEHARKIKEVFRSTMATTVVGVLNAYRKPDCRESRITNTEDFKHLARKLTHFVMLKEMKHINTIDELICTDNVKAKAREYIKKYMSKFGEVYQKRHDEPDFKD